jgi:hypothetical protein
MFEFSRFFQPLTLKLAHIQVNICPATSWRKSQMYFGRILCHVHQSSEEFGRECNLNQEVGFNFRSLRLSPPS